MLRHVGPDGSGETWGSTWFHVKPEEGRWRVAFVEGLLADVVRAYLADEWSVMPSQPLPRGRHRFAFQQ